MSNPVAIYVYPFSLLWERQKWKYKFLKIVNQIWITDLIFIEKKSNYMEKGNAFRFPKSFDKYLYPYYFKFWIGKERRMMMKIIAMVYTKHFQRRKNS